MEMLTSKVLGSQLGTLYVQGFSWTNNEKDPMVLDITHQGNLIMRLSIQEAIQYAGRKNILNAVKELDNSSWIESWQEEKHQELIDILKG